MLDAVVRFDVERYATVPDRLARIAGDLHDAAVRLGATGDPGGSAAAAGLDLLVGWVRREQARAAARWERLLAIPGFEPFGDWDADLGRFVYDVDWVSRTDGDLHTYEEVAALVLYQRHLRVLRLQSAEDPFGADEVDEALAALADVDDPGVAAALLGVLGADGYRGLHRALAATAGEGGLERVEDGLATLTALFATASRATGPERLRESFLDDLLGPAAGVPATGWRPSLDDARLGPPASGHRPLDLDVDERLGAAAAGAAAAADRDAAVDAAQALVDQLGFGADVAGRLAGLTGLEGTVAVLERAGATFAVLGLAAPVVEAIQHGLDSPEFAESAITTSLGLAASAAGNPLAAGALLTGGVLVQLIFASADDAGPPRRPARGGDRPGGPGSGTADLYLDEAGVPIAANGV